MDFILSFFASRFSDLFAIKVVSFTAKEVTIETINGFVTETVVTTVTIDASEAIDLTLYTRGRSVSYEMQYLTEEQRREQDSTTFHYTAAGHCFWSPATEEEAKGLPLTKRIKGKTKTITMDAPSHHHTMTVGERPATEEEIAAYKKYAAYIQSVVNSGMYASEEWIDF